MSDHFQTLYTFDDIILIPQMTTLKSRSEADTSVKIWKYDRPNPIISANMKTVTDSEMAMAMWDAGGIGAIHRFCDIETNVKEYIAVMLQEADCFVSVGVHDVERAEALYEAGARMFVIDIAHGHSVQMEETIKWMRDKWGEGVYIMAGNIATGKAARDLCEWGADAIKIGIGPGGVCTTRRVTGHGVPQFSAIQDCVYWSSHYEKLLVADGGIRSSGDIVKSIVAGAGAVMMGGMLAPAKESAAPMNNGMKFYKGSAAEPKRGQIASEGTYTTLHEGGTCSEIVGELVAGLRSGMSYSNARTLGELNKNAKWKLQTSAGYHEGLPHGAK